jgi:hypothetical protein
MKEGRDGTFSVGSRNMKGWEFLLRMAELLAGRTDPIEARLHSAPLAVSGGQEFF